MPSDPIVIAAYARTPMGGLLGDFASAKATDLGAAAVKAAVERSGVNADQIDRIYMGCVLPAGLGQAPARQAALAAGLPRSVQATTINKVCGSGMQAIIFAYETISAGNADVIIAGGMESMSNAPYLLQKHRTGARAGHDTVKDSMFLDGLEDAYEQGTSMGIFAENTVKKFGFSREEQDNYAIESLSRAKAAIASGAFEGEIVAVDVTTRSGSQTISIDEQPGKAKPEKIPTLKPAFIKDGTVTAANSSSISDGAAAVVVTRASVAARLGMTVVAQIIGSDCYAHEPGDFPSAPVPAIQKLLKKINWTVNDVDLFEVNEAFAVVPMIAMRELGIPHEKMNVNGGACALGHPLGASGARIVTTLLGALKGRGLKRGVAGICLGGGEATALAIELM
jgi:acetyl-CoA C-acetyltransferase